MAGIAFTIIACACFAALDASTKFVSTVIPLFMALWLRYLFQALLTTAWVLPRHGLSILRTSQPRFQCLRALLFAGCSIFAFLSLRYLPLAKFTAIASLTPIVVTAIAAAWEHITDLRVWIAVLAMGMASAIGHMLLLKAYSHTTPTVIAPLMYSQIAFALLSGWVFYQHMPDSWALIGMLAIAASGVASAWLTVREAR